MIRLNETVLCDKAVKLDDLNIKLYSFANVSEDFTITVNQWHDGGHYKRLFLQSVKASGFIEFHQRVPFYQPFY